MKDAVFPSLVFHEMGYESAHFGQGQWNGVAILSKVGLDNVINNFAVGEPDGEARIISAECGGITVVCVYVPNGRELEHDHYQYKLRWMKQLKQHVAKIAKPAGDVIVTGDFNIAPDDRDVHDPAAWAGQILCSDPERAALQSLLGLGLHDSFRLFEQPPASFSWWDYRQAGFRRNLGLRIDLVLASEALRTGCTASLIDREPRRAERPSDHAPVVAHFTVL
jgi:exodeoxyribonuclease-3